jgi:hypothetical protein
LLPNKSYVTVDLGIGSRLRSANGSVKSPIEIGDFTTFQDAASDRSQAVPGADGLISLEQNTFSAAIGIQPEPMSGHLAHPGD